VKSFCVLKTIVLHKRRQFLKFTKIQAIIDTLLGTISTYNYKAYFAKVDPSNSMHQNGRKFILLSIIALLVCPYYQMKQLSSSLLKMI